MKRLAFLISLLMAGQVLAYGTAKEDTSTAITFVHSIGMDSVRYYAGQDTSSWEINRLMVRGFSPDSTNYVLIDTFDNPGTYFVKIEYWEGGAASAKYLPDIRDVAPAQFGIDWANIVNPTGSTPDVNVGKVAGDGTAATNLEIFFDNTGSQFTNFDDMYDGTGYVGGSIVFKADISKVGGDAIVDNDDGQLEVNVEKWKDQVPLDPTVGGAIKSSTYEMLDNVITAAKIATDAFTDDQLATSFAVELLETDTSSIDAGFAQMLKDTLAYQGAGSSAEDIKNAVWGQTVDTAFAAGSMGDSAKVWGASGSGASAADIWNYNITDFKDTTSNIRAGQYQFSVGLHNVEHSTPTLQMKVGQGYTGAVGSNIEDDFDSLFADVAAIGGGSGANTCSLWVYDTGNTVMVSDIKVRANNSSGANQGMDRTNVTGIAVLNLDDGDYNLVIPMNSGYIQTTNPQPFTVSGATNDTIDVTWFSPSAPAGDLCTVYNYVKDANDNGIAGVVITATIPTNFWPITYEGQAIKATYTIKTNTVGLWQLPVFPSGLLLTVDGDSASFYQFTASGQLFGPMGIKVTVPTDSTTFFMMPDDEQ